MNILTRCHIAMHDRKWRRKLKKLFAKMKSVGRNVQIGPNYSISSPEKMIIGDHVWIGANFFAKAEGEITIGSGTIIARNVEIWTANHHYDSEDLMAIPYDKRMVLKSVSIGENVWVGTHVLFVPGVTVGEGAVIGMGAVVTKDVPPMAIVGGNPAKIIKYRDKKVYEKLKTEGKIYLDVEYDFDHSSLRKSEYKVKGKLKMR